MIAAFFEELINGLFMGILKFVGVLLRSLFNKDNLKTNLEKDLNSLIGFLTIIFIVVAVILIKRYA